MLLLLYAFLADWQHVTTLRQSPLKCIPLMQGMANHMSMCRNKAQHTSLACHPSKLMSVQAKTLKIALQLHYRVASKLKAIVRYVLS